MNYITIAAGTLLIILFSWSYSIRHGRYHGIPRFFSFESIFLLVIFNFKIWFQDSFSPLQIVSWIFLLMSAYMGIAGFLLLWKRGKPRVNIENTTVLVKSNLYGYIRHPLYASLLLLGTGIMLKDPDPLQLTLGFVNIGALYITARIEENEMLQKFGNEYSNYLKQTKMFIPFIF